MWICSIGNVDVFVVCIIHRSYRRALILMDTSLKISVPLLVSILICPIVFLMGQGWSQANTQYMKGATAFYQNQQLQVNASILHQSFPIIEVENQRVRQGQVFDSKKNVRAYDHTDGDISSRIEVFGEVNTKVKGVYVLRYVVRNSLGLKSVRHIQVLVD